jgi:putative Holliday junction resolvase
MRILGIDYGTRRVGLALSDERGDFAYPHSVILNNNKLLSAIAELCQKEQVGQIVIGESKDYAGRPNIVMEEILKFVEKMTAEIKIPIDYEPEFLTSAEADQVVGGDDETDARAAAIILRSYIARLGKSAACPPI